MAVAMSATTDTVTTKSQRLGEQSFFAADAGVAIARRALSTALQEEIEQDTQWHCFLRHKWVHLHRRPACGRRVPRPSSDPRPYACELDEPSLLYERQEPRPAVVPGRKARQQAQRIKWRELHGRFPPAVRLGHAPHHARRRALRSRRGRAALFDTRDRDDRSGRAVFCHRERAHYNEHQSC